MAWLSNELSQTGTSVPLRGASTDVDIRSLPAGASVTVDTKNSRYCLVMLNGEEQMALVQGGQLFPEQTEARVEGSTLGEGLLQLGKIGVGRCLEMSVDGERVVTSRICSITMEPAHP